MIKKIYFFIIILLFILPLKLFPQKFSFISAGYSLKYFDYKEMNDNGDFLNSEKGAINGGNIIFQYSFKNEIGFPLFININTEISYSPSIYKGFLQPSMTPYNTTTFNTFFRIEGLLGYIFEISKLTNLSFYSGCGYYSWVRDIQGSAGYKEHYRWLYFPFGIKLAFNLSDNFNIGLDLTFRYLINPKLTAYLAEKNNPSYPYDANVKIPNSISFHISLIFDYFILDNLSITLIPWFYTSSFNKSNFDSIYLFEKGMEVYLPKNRTYQAGIFINITFYFNYKKQLNQQESK